MNRYTSLIRKLVNATANAERYGDDIVQTLKGRCFNDTNIVRQTLMNAVCDPRFKYHATVTGYWKEEAINALEQFAESLETIDNLTIDMADTLLEIFLSTWFEMNFSEKAGDQLNKVYHEPAHNEASDLDEIENAMRFFDFFEENGSGKKNTTKGERAEESEEKNEEKSATEPLGKSPKEESRNNKSEQTKEMGGFGKGIAKGTFQSMQKLENNFLKKIPSSLVTLAKKIGRASNDPNAHAGKFLRGGKSDIAGITTGNDLHSLLPSELALLSDPLTKDVFYRRFTEERLQIFATASQSNSPRRHQNGPVIICIDTSSSMYGTPLLVAKALAIAVAIISWREKRNVIMVKYSDSYEYIDLGNNRSKTKKMTEFLSFVSMGGNNENEMFIWLFKEIKPSLESYKTADILCVSDFGWVPIDTETQSIIQSEKDGGMLFYGLNVSRSSMFMDLHDIVSTDKSSPMNVCDSIWIYEDGECKEVAKNSAETSSKTANP